MRLCVYYSGHAASRRVEADSDENKSKIAAYMHSLLIIKKTCSFKEDVRVVCLEYL